MIGKIIAWFFWLISGFRELRRQIPNLRQGKWIIEVELGLKSDPERFWKWGANTDWWNEQVGFGTINRYDDPHSKALIAGFDKFWGLMKIRWVELPTQWIRGQWFLIRRRFISGPVIDLSAELKLTPFNDANGNTTKLQYTVTATTRNFLAGFISAVEMCFVRVPLFIAAFQKAEALALEPTTTNTVVTNTPAVTIARGGEVRLARLYQKLLQVSFEDDLARLLKKAILTMSDDEAAHIRPYEWADRWGKPRDQVFDFMLVATKVGLLNKRLGHRCSECGGTPVTSATLNNVVAKVFCRTCEVDSKIDIDDLLEASFSVVDEIRNGVVGEFCAANPEDRAHIVARIVVSPCDNRSITPHLSPGKYRLHYVGTPGRFVEARAESQIELTIDPRAEWSIPSTIDLSPYIHLTSPAGFITERVFVIERTGWRDNAATVRDLATNPHFRDLFPMECLPMGIGISLQNVAILFTDIKGSTKFYQRVGDARALEVVLDHFRIIESRLKRYGATCIKRIGDAVMAISNTRAELVLAALEAQDECNRRCGPYDIAVRVGIHYGAVMITTLNNGDVDAFGTNVNLASRIEALSTSEDVVVSDPVFEDPGVQELEKMQIKHVEAFDATLKGFDGMQKLHRFYFTRNAPK